MKLLWILIKKKKSLVMLSLSAGILSLAAILIWNDRLALVIERISAGEDVEKSLIAVILFSLLFVVVSSPVNELMAGFTCEHMNHELRMWYAGKLYGVGESTKKSADTLRCLSELSSGEKVSKLHNEIKEITQYISLSLFQLAYNGLSLIMSFGWILYINPKLTLLANAPMLPILLYVILSSRIIGRESVKRQEGSMKINGIEGTIMELFPVVKLYRAEKLMLGQFAEAVALWSRASMREERARAVLMSISAALSCLPLLLLLLIGGHMVLEGELELGILYVFVNLSGNISGVMINMPGFIGGFRRFAANMSRL